ncbi:MAG: UPF0716 protein FxsA [Alteromonadaceae bacterium]
MVNLMFRILFMLFLVVPIVEISILIQLSEVIGGWPTILLVIITAYLGAKMVKQQGLQTVQQIQQKSASGQLPAEELFSGVCILISGVLLLTPGILTDVFGFLLLTPVVRQRMVSMLKKKIHLFGANASANVFGGGQGSAFTFTSSHHHNDDEKNKGDVFESTDFSSRDDTDKQLHSIEQSKSDIDGKFERKE